MSKPAEETPLPDVSRTRAKPYRLQHTEGPAQASGSVCDSGQVADREPEPLPLDWMDRMPDRAGVLVHRTHVPARVYAALTAPFDPDAGAQVRLVPSVDPCSDCGAEMKREQRYGRTYLSCAHCRKHGELERAKRGNEYVRWIRETPNERQP